MLEHADQDEFSVVAWPLFGASCSASVGSLVHHCAVNLHAVALAGLLYHLHRHRPRHSTNPEQQRAMAVKGALVRQAQQQDPATDKRWAGIKWTIYRGKAYDITNFIARHPGGEWLVNLAIGRDCTALFESYHLRHDVAVQAFNKLPVLEGFPVDAVERAPYPADSKLYTGVCVCVCAQPVRT